MAVLQAGRLAFAADQEPGAFGQPEPDVALHVVPLLLADHGSDRGRRIARIAELDRRHRRFDRIATSPSFAAGTGMRLPAMQAWPLF